MIKARANNFILLGLSDVNMERLKKGQPIKFNLRDIGSDMNDIDVVIYNGRTEDSMQAELQEFIRLLLKRSKMNANSKRNTTNDSNY